MKKLESRLIAKLFNESLDAAVSTARKKQDATLKAYFAGLKRTLAPKPYTRKQSTLQVEIYTHGGPIELTTILRTKIKIPKKIQAAYDALSTHIERPSSLTCAKAVEWLTTANYASVTDLEGPMTALIATLLKKART